MEYNIHVRAKNNGYQYIISYKDYLGKWRQISKQGYKKPKEAEMSAHERLKDLKKLIQVDSSTKAITLKSFLNTHLQDITPHKSANTIRNYVNAINKFDLLLDKPISKITNRDIQLNVNNMVLDGLKNSTIKSYLTILKIVLRASIEFKIIHELPPIKIKLPAVAPAGINNFNLDDTTVKNIIESFRDNQYYLIVLVAVNTGLRVGEIMGITWDNIDLENKTINVCRQWKLLKEGVYGFGTLKSNNSYRIVPFSDSLKSILSPLKSKGRIVQLNNTGTVVSEINERLKAYNTTLHKLRHFYCTKLISNGLDFKTVASLMGHEVKQTLKIYSHYNEDMKIKAHSVINEIF